MPLKSFLQVADPFFLSRRALTKEIVAAAPLMSGLLLDVGCGTKPYRDLFANVEYYGAEVATASKYGSAKRADLFFDGARLPVLDASVDSILCSQVLDHVFAPDAFLAELHRVLRPRGRLLLTVPFVWDEHEQPYDFARYSSFGLRHLAAKHGFSVAHAARTLPNASIFAQLWMAYVHKVLRPVPSLLGKALVALVALPTNLIGLLFGALLPESPDLYLDNVMVWVKDAATEETR